MRTGLALFVAVVALLADAGGQAAAPPHTVLGARPTKPGGWELARYDARTLSRVGKALRPGVSGWNWVRSPRGTHVALVGDGRPRLAVVELATLRRTALVTLAPADLSGRARVGYPVGAAWPRADRLVVAARSSDGERGVVLVVDPRRGVVLRALELEGSILRAARTAEGLALLLGRTDRIGPTRLALVDADGEVREVALTTRAGWSRGEEPESTTNPPRTRIPGLAADPAAGSIYVVGHEEPVAEVDVRTASVRYHPVIQRRVAHATKVISGPMLQAEWLGGNRLAVSGTIYDGIDAGTRLLRERPVGLKIVDTRRWTQRTVDDDVRWIVLSGGFLLAPGPDGLTWYDGELRRRGHFEAARGAVEPSPAGARVLLRTFAAPRRTVVVDLRNGRTRQRPYVAGNLPTFLVGTGSPLG